jgi:hypothetical protein
MDIERFEALALAYGGAPGRWPAAERDAALDFLTREPDAARAALKAAESLDLALDCWRAPEVSANLRDRVLALAPKARAPKALASPRGFGFWLSGAGFAAAALAGVIVGVAASSAAVSDVRADTVLSATLTNENESALAPFTVGALEGRTT